MASRDSRSNSTVDNIGQVRKPSDKIKPMCEQDQPGVEPTHEKQPIEATKSTESFCDSDSTTSSVGKTLVLECPNVFLGKRVHRSIRQTLQDVAMCTIGSLSQRGFSFGKKKTFKRKPIPF